ncbi:Pimeloyl-ACP methyl ester carboxylesterase [Rhizobiales bacterium GAS113]|nr:Pimeloyl-ACP methyl ester carboxylesterase [Rhizobiales bacterium GAS113]
MATASVNGVSLAYDDEGGGGAPPLLFVHGHPFDRSMWRLQLAAFARKDQRVIAPDLRGYGESAVVAGKTTLDIFARDLEALLEALGVEGRVILCGLSMGGQIVMEFCRLFPERVAAIVLAATSPQAETEAGKHNRNLMADRLLREGMGPYAEEILPKMLAPNSIATKPGIAQHVLGMMRSAPPEGAAAALRGRAERPPYEGVLAAFAHPALIVVGDEDAFTTRADAELMQRLLEDSELLFLEGIGHMPNLESEARFNAALERLLATVAAVAAP